MSKPIALHQLNYGDRTRLVAKPEAPIVYSAWQRVIDLRSVESCAQFAFAIDRIELCICRNRFSFRFLLEHLDVWSSILW
ncbi:hypothetical protein [Chamaesiphon sp.]|uniref:hypothetical protein n=1 Tax=Chamaesiphon sp. TaxID=2814140 RepID=UPI00359350C3